MSAAESIYLFTAKLPLSVVSALDRKAIQIREETGRHCSRIKLVERIITDALANDSALRPHLKGEDQ